MELNILSTPGTAVFTCSKCRLLMNGKTENQETNSIQLSELRNSYYSYIAHLFSSNSDGNRLHIEHLNQSKACRLSYLVNSRLVAMQKQIC